MKDAKKNAPAALSAEDLNTVSGGAATILDDAQLGKTQVTGAAEVDVVAQNNTTGTVVNGNVTGGANVVGSNTIVRSSKKTGAPSRFK